MKCYTIFNLIQKLLIVTDINLQVKLGDLGGKRNNCRDIGDNVSVGSYPFIILHKGHTLKFGKDQIRINENEMQNALKTFPKFLGGNSYGNSLLLIQWIDEGKNNCKFFEHQANGSKIFVDGFGETFSQLMIYIRFFLDFGKIF